MKKIVAIRLGMLGLLAALTLAGCNKDNSQELKEQEMQLLQQYLASNNITVDPTASGLYYIPIREGTGVSPELGTWVEVQYVGELIDGTVFSTSIEETAEKNGIHDEDFLYGPTRLQVGNIGLEGLNEGIQLMKVGGEAVLILPSELGLGGYTSGLVPAYSTLIYTIEVLVAFDDPEKHEQEKIWNYLKEGSFADVDSTETGLYYIRVSPGTGELFDDGDHVDVYYTGKFLDGRVFDSNLDEEAYTFSVPGSTNIGGWQEGIKLMRDKEKGILIIPYTMGYGPEGRYDQYGRVVIPPYMTLVFEMEAELSQ